jgi:hypothetical protein
MQGELLRQRSAQRVAVLPRFLPTLPKACGHRECRVIRRNRGIGAEMNLWEGPSTVGDFIEALSAFPKDWPVKVATPAGGGIGVEHRDVNGKPVVGIFGKNGGRFGENPLTEEEYKKRSQEFLSGLRYGKLYTSIHGDHRLYYHDMGSQATCYGDHFDRRIIERMVQEGLIPAGSVDLDRVARCER